MFLSVKNGMMHVIDSQQPADDIDTFFSQGGDEPCKKSFPRYL